MDNLLTFLNLSNFFDVKCKEKEMKNPISAKIQKVLMQYFGDLTAIHHKHLLQKKPFVNTTLTDNLTNACLDKIKSSVMEKHFGLHDRRDFLTAFGSLLERLAQKGIFDDIFDENITNSIRKFGELINKSITVESNSEVESLQKKIMEQINETGTSILLTGMFAHATVMSIKALPEGKFQATYHNTGGGNQGKVIRECHLNDENDLRELLNKAIKANQNFVYSSSNSELNQWFEERKLPSFKFFEDFERPQQQGSCSYSSMYSALFLHLHREMEEKFPEEKIKIENSLKIIFSSLISTVAPERDLPSDVNDFMKNRQSDRIKRIYRSDFISNIRKHTPEEEIDIRDINEYLDFFALYPEDQSAIEQFCSDYHFPEEELRKHLINSREIEENTRIRLENQLRSLPFADGVSNREISIFNNSKFTEFKIINYLKNNNIFHVEYQEYLHKNIKNILNVMTDPRNSNFKKQKIFEEFLNNIGIISSDPANNELINKIFIKTFHQIGDYKIFDLFAKTSLKEIQSILNNLGCSENDSTEEDIEKLYFILHDQKVNIVEKVMEIKNFFEKNSISIPVEFDQKFHDYFKKLVERIGGQYKENIIDFASCKILPQGSILVEEVEDLF